MDLSIQCGFGWQNNCIPWINYNDVPIIRGSGEFFDNCMIMILPDYFLGVVVATNSQHGDIFTLTTETAKLALEVKTGVNPQEVKEPLYQ